MSALPASMTTVAPPREVDLEVRGVAATVASTVPALAAWNEALPSPEIDGEHVVEVAAVAVADPERVAVDRSQPSRPSRRRMESRPFGPIGVFEARRRSSWSSSLGPPERADRGGRVVGTHLVAGQGLEDLLAAASVGRGLGRRSRPARQLVGPRPEAEGSNERLDA